MSGHDIGNSEEPDFSVIIPSFNRAHLLPRAVQSVLNQTHHNFELIIVNDGSVDNTASVVRTFVDRRIIYLQHEHNKGGAAARNTGLNIAKGKYIIIMGDDDELTPDALECAYNKFHDLSGADVHIIMFNCVDAETNIYSGMGIGTEGYIKYEDYICGKIKGDYFTIIEREIIGDTRYDERLWGHETLFWLRMFKKSKVYYFPKTIYLAYRQHGERMSTTKSFISHINDVIFAKNVYLEDFGEELKQICPRKYGMILTELGFYYVLNDQKKEGRNTILESFKYHLTPKAVVVYIVSYFLSSKSIKRLYVTYRHHE